MTALILYMALVLAAFLPREADDLGIFCPRGSVSFASALFSSLALPWSGIPIIHPAGAGSWSWFPSIVAAVLVSPVIPSETSRGLAEKNFLTASIALSAVSMSRVMYVSGIPGPLFSIEGLSMAARLRGYEGFGAPAMIALCMIMAGLFLSFLSFASVCSHSAAFSVMSFSFSGFLTLTFIPLNLPGFTWATPRCYAILTPVSAFAISCAIRAIFMRRAAKRGNLGILAGRAKLLPLALTAAGAFLLSSL
ncbi:MAG: hypothetical protein LBI74_07180 [Synergistaceae bacterium]|nr:hypothetical protein [Synergistaceae bacterium]